MSTLSVKATALAVVVGMASLVSARQLLQQGATGGGGGGAPPGKSKPKSKLELALEEALKNNPDLRVAAAKAALAEAELAQARLTVARKVVTAQAAADGAKSLVESAVARLDQAQRTRARQPGAISRDDLAVLEQAVVQAKTKQAAADAELDYLLGKSPAEKTSPRSTAAAHAAAVEKMLRVMMAAEADLVVPRVAVADRDAAAKIRKALDRRMTVKVVNTASNTVLELVRKEAPGLHIQAPGSGTDARWNTLLTANLADVPLSAVLQLLEDNAEVRFVVRDYGLLAVPENKVPPGAVLLSDFLKKGEAKTPEKKTESKAKP